MYIKFIIIICFWEILDFNPKLRLLDAAPINFTNFESLDQIIDNIPDELLLTLVQDESDFKKLGQFIAYLPAIISGSKIEKRPYSDWNNWVKKINTWSVTIPPQTPAPVNPWNNVWIKNQQPWGWAPPVTAAPISWNKGGWPSSTASGKWVKSWVSSTVSTTQSTTVSTFPPPTPVTTTVAPSPCPPVLIYNKLVCPQSSSLPPSTNIPITKIIKSWHVASSEAPPSSVKSWGWQPSTTPPPLPSQKIVYAKSWVSPTPKEKSWVAPSSAQTFVPTPQPQPVWPQIIQLSKFYIQSSGGKDDIKISQSTGKWIELTPTPTSKWRDWNSKIKYWKRSNNEKNLHGEEYNYKLIRKNKESKKSKKPEYVDLDLMPEKL